MSLFSAPGKGSYQNNTCEITVRGVVVHPDYALIKTTSTVVPGRVRYAQDTKVPGAYRPSGKA